MDPCEAFKVRTRSEYRHNPTGRSERVGQASSRRTAGWPVGVAC